MSGVDWKQRMASNSCFTCIVLVKYLNERNRKREVDFTSGHAVGQEDVPPFRLAGVACSKGGGWWWGWSASRCLG